MPRQKIIHSLPRPKEFLEGYEGSRKPYASALNLLNKFLSKEYSKYDYDSIIDAIKNEDVNVYEIFRKFNSYIESSIKPNSIGVYNAVIRSYLDYFDIEISQRKFKRKVRPPRKIKIEPYPLEKHQIREILRNCHNRRLRPFLFILASAATREEEVLAIRKQDIDFKVRPTTIRLRGEFTKTRTDRYIFISDEATEELKKWLEYKDDWNSRNPDNKRVFTDTDLVFTQNKKATPESIYQRVLSEFHTLLESLKMDQRKDNSDRRQIVLHSFRHWVFTLMEERISKGFAEAILGHTNSYYTKGLNGKREDYLKVMPDLTYLDYSILEATGKNIEAQLEQKDKEIAYLRERDEVNADTINNLSDKLMEVTSRLDRLEKR